MGRRVLAFIPEAGRNPKNLSKDMKGVGGTSDSSLLPECDIENFALAGEHANLRGFVQHGGDVRQGCKRSHFLPLTALYFQVGG